MDGIEQLDHAVSKDSVNSSSHPYNGVNSVMNFETQNAPYNLFQHDAVSNGIDDLHFLNDAPPNDFPPPFPDGEMGNGYMGPLSPLAPPNSNVSSHSDKDTNSYDSPLPNPYENNASHNVYPSLLTAQPIPYENSDFTHVAAPQQITDPNENIILSHIIAPDPNIHPYYYGNNMFHNMPAPYQNNYYSPYSSNLDPYGNHFNPPHSYPQFRNLLFSLSWSFVHSNLVSTYPQQNYDSSIQTTTNHYVTTSLVCLQTNHQTPVVNESMNVRYQFPATIHNAAYDVPSNLLFPDHQQPPPPINKMDVSNQQKYGNHQNQGPPSSSYILTYEDQIWVAKQNLAKAEAALALFESNNQLYTYNQMPAIQTCAAHLRKCFSTEQITGMDIVYDSVENKGPLQFVRFLVMVKENNIIKVAEGIEKRNQHPYMKYLHYFLRYKDYSRVEHLFDHISYEQFIGLTKELLLPVFERKDSRDNFITLLSNAKKYELDISSLLESASSALDLEKILKKVQTYIVFPHTETDLMTRGLLVITKKMAMSMITYLEAGHDLAHCVLWKAKVVPMLMNCLYLLEESGLYYESIVKSLRHYRYKLEHLFDIYDVTFIKPHQFLIAIPEEKRARPCPNGVPTLFKRNLFKFERERQEMDNKNCGKRP
uniref:PUM-HD domain-containing protein n=1 Tax=Rhabditophanes sp. KR3021 TaxID=114890 RepID=A0AC35TG79_9BILA